MSELIPAEIRRWLSSFQYKIELHAHTNPASSCSELPPAEVINRVAALGYDAVAITNHFNADGSYMRETDPVGAYMRDYYTAKEAGEKAGIRVYLGAEFRFTENSNDYLVYGVDETFLRETVTAFGMSYVQFYETYHSPDILILQAHPFRNGIIPVSAEHVDGIETCNLHPHHNSRTAIASLYAREKNIPIVTVGTDLHHPGHEGMGALRTRTLPETDAELVSLLRSGDYLFEIGGYPILPYAQFSE